MGTNIQVRHAVPEDREEWLRMRLTLWPHCSVQDHIDEIGQHFVEPGRNAVLVAATNDTPRLCGFAEISIRSEYVESANSSPVAYLEGWYVDPEWRGKGVGRQLIVAAEQWALECGVSELASDTELTNQQSISAHVACGFTDAITIVHFVKRLAPKPSP